MPDGPRVLISILNWNSTNATITAISSVLESTFDNYSLLVIDNNSKDDFTSILIKRFPDILIRRTSTNLGYAGAHKIAAERAIREGFDLLWILNNDLTVDKDALEYLVEAYKRNPLAIFGSISLSDQNIVKFGGGAEILDNYNNDEDQGYNPFQGKSYHEAGMKERPVSDLGGASILIPVAIIKKYGFIDTKYFLYAEETDYSYYLRRKHNIHSIIVPNSIIRHHGEGSFTASERLQLVKIYYQTRNNHHFYTKYFANYRNPKVGGLLHYFKFFFLHLFRGSQKKKDFEYQRLYYEKLGFFHALIGLRGRIINPDNFFTC